MYARPYGQVYVEPNITCTLKGVVDSFVYTLEAYTV